MLRKTKKPLIILGLITMLLVVGFGGHYFFILLPKQMQVHAFVSQEVPLTDLHAGQGCIEPTVPSFVDAASRALPAVVHIAANGNPKVIEPLAKFFRKFFDRWLRPTPIAHQSQAISMTGSGVIISGDGYIVTSYHVVRGAAELVVTLNDNRRYVAKIVGTDPDTDLALMKIEAKNLSYLPFGDSDQLQVGECVAAIGNPVSLDFTVTQGIVSAKARGVKPFQQALPHLKIGSFIQTDAAIGPGNSGGALVNLQGELVGITITIFCIGTFVSYGFAIPSAIVMRVVQDLRVFGAVQRAMLGIYPEAMNADLAAKKHLKRFTGIYVARLIENSPAATAGLQEGDVIIAIDSHPIKSLEQLYERLVRYQPNDKVSVTFDRKGEESTIQVILTSSPNKMKLTPDHHILAVAGAAFENIDEATQQKLSIIGGIQIRNIQAGKWQQAGINKGFIIRAIDEQPVKSLDQLASILISKKSSMLVEGIYPDGTRSDYTLRWDDE